MFWERNRGLLADAWTEWDETEGKALPRLDDSVFHPDLRAAIDTAWENPDSEDAVRKLWKEITPGVVQCPFFDSAGIAAVRSYMRAAADAGIPVRPPYGIVLNREGAMLDPRSAGFLAPPAFQALYEQIVGRIMRPVSRLLFPEVMGFDQQTFGFSIVYRPGLDTSIRPHTDASTTTLNVNLNLPEERFSGSEVDFFDRRTGETHPFVFEPGVAVLHRGNAAHAARPITQGERTNLVLWLYGSNGRTPSQHDVESPAAAARWTVPSGPSDGFAPF
jgi:hypothetical protein